MCDVLSLLRPGFVRDRFTTLPETKDRAFCTKVYLKYELAAGDLYGTDFNGTWSALWGIVSSYTDFAVVTAAAAAAVLQDCRGECFAGCVSRPALSRGFLPLSAGIMCV